MEELELTKQQKIWVAHQLEYYKLDWFSEFTKGVVYGFLLGLSLGIAIFIV